jgi:transglutaminase-like putative cysteine protease
MSRRLGLWLICLLGTLSAAAQPQEILDIAARYPGENAVILNKSEHLVLKYDNKNQLTATSEISQEILLLTDLASGIYNTSDIYHSSFHQLVSWEAASHIPDRKGYKTVKASLLKSTNLENENVFFDDNKVSIIGFSGLVKLATIDTRYVLKHEVLNFLPPFYFQSYTPTIRATYSITAPKSVNVKTILEYTDASLLTATTEEHKNTITYTWTAKEIGRYKDYSNSPSSPVGRPHIIPYISDYKPEAGKSVAMIANPDDLYRFIYQYIRNTNQKEIPEIKQKTQELIAGCTNDRCKAEKIYRWVQENIRYVAFEDSLGGFVPREADLVYQRKFGDCKDMTSMQVAMLRAAGLQATYAWIGTRDKPYMVNEVPLPLIFNHMICAWNDHGKWVLLDGTHPTIRFGVPPYALQGKEAVISIDDTHYDVVKVPETDAAMNTTVDSAWISINDQNEIEGKLKIKFTGYAEWTMKNMMRYSNESENEKTIKSLAKRGSNKFFQKSGRYESKEDNICFYSEFGIKDYVQRIDKELYINLNLLRYNNEQKIDDIAQRKLPVMNKYKTIVTQVVCLQIPKGYQVAYLPPDAAHTEPGVWGYKIKYTQQNNQVICTKEFIESELYITQKDFARNNQLTDELNEHYKETLILKAIAP